MSGVLFQVDRTEAGKTLAAVLKRRYGLTWSRAKRLVEGRHVRVGQQISDDITRRLKLGIRVEIAPGVLEVKLPLSPAQLAKKARAKEKKAAGPAVPRAPRPPREDPFPPASVEVVYNDAHVVVANKPAGLTTMRHAEEAAEFGPGKRFLPKTLADLLPGLLGDPGRPVIPVHRIDRDTSGLVVFARTTEAADHLTRLFKRHAVDRLYVALTRGVPAGGRIDSVLVRDRGDGRRGSTRKSNPPDGKRAVTFVEVAEELGEFAAVECRLETGRTHQIRIHLGETGTPLCGERIYDRPLNGKPVADESGAVRPLLHAARLGFAHPVTGETMAWEADPPADFMKVWEKLRGGS